MQKKSAATSIAREIKKNERLSQYITSVIQKEYSPLEFDVETRKETVKNNKAFFNEVTKPVLGK